MRALLLLALLAACAPPSDDGPAGEAHRLGLDVHLGQAVAENSVESADGSVTTTFTTDSGPLCLRGDPFRAAVREGSSDDLLIFLQGGGACWSKFCLAVTQAPPGMPSVDVLGHAAWNPFRDHDVAYAPYCDGSLFSGDADVDEDGDGAPDRFHHGLANLSATLDLARGAFPEPRRVVLGGSSGGAYGTFLGVVLVRAVYPDAEIVVLADSGTGVARGPDDPAYVHDLLDEIGALRFVPDDCEGCLDDGHVTGVLDWWLARDPDVRVGVFSSWYDSIIGDVFLQVPPATFRDQLAAATGALHDAWPDRYRRFIVDGRMHTTLLGDPTGIVGSDLSALELPPDALDLFTDLELGHLDTTGLGAVAFSDWVQGLLDDDRDVWTDLTAEPGPVPAR